ncbi:AP2 domain protein [Gregarina niphandrodes]|uniref:AP2 domain protein n=1 Tax=Gregarina niphandrodes TaxID=110365 RepID=A0A023B194_GRENI|nr:AP2 domain protein [Gregarina niphandrodes]EZG46511.1 AP2 domain protein [Gregarina niphandrodes]|eukprot:XP_011132284.1 AP2 domain protein [Gregarina niphandrodes]
MSREDGAVHMDGPLVDATNMALAQATAIPEGRVVGVYFDKQRRIWRATWREHGQGKRKTKNFSVDDYGFEEARRMAIQFRLVKLMEASDQALQEQGILQQQGVSAHDYESNMTPTGGSNRKKRRRYGSPETFAPKLPLWAQPYCNEGADEVHQASQIWPPLYGHPAAFVHMEQLRSTQQSWADTSEDRMQMCVAEHAQAPTLERGMLDRADMVSTVDSMGQEHHKLYEAEPRPAGSGIIC